MLNILRFTTIYYDLLAHFLTNYKELSGICFKFASAMFEQINIVLKEMNF